jgi:hypothetical protein
VIFWVGFCDFRAKFDGFLWSSFGFLMVRCGDLCGVLVAAIFATFWKYFCGFSVGMISSYWAMIMAALLDMAYVWDGMKGTMSGKLYVTVTVT